MSPSIGAAPRRLLLLAACFLPLLLAACGGSSSTKASPTTAPTKAPAASIPAATAVAGATTAPGPTTASGSSTGVIHRCGDDPSAPAPSIARVQRTGEHSYSKPPEMVIDPNKSYTATIQTDKGNIVLELAAKDVPQTTNNFVFLSCSGFYDGLVFHRVVADFSGSTPTAVANGAPRLRARGFFCAATTDERRLNSYVHADQR